MTEEITREEATKNAKRIAEQEAREHAEETARRLATEDARQYAREEQKRAFEEMFARRYEDYFREEYKRAYEVAFAKACAERLSIGPDGVQELEQDTVQIARHVRVDVRERGC